MADTSSLSSNGSNAHPEQHQGSLDELRQLLLAPEHEQLLNLQRKLDESREDPNQLRAMIEEGVKASIEENPEALAAAVSPIMFPAIRQAIRQILQGMMQSLNQTLEQSFSLNGLKWRWESMRTGKPFAEIVLLNTLLYSVEQVFLIHRETGLLLRHVVAPKAQTLNPEAVSGMMTAIQDFVHDAFQVGAGDTLETFQVGELTTWVERGEVAYLAALVRGNPPKEVRTTFKDTLDTIHRDFDDALDEFQGDKTPFEAAEPALEACLLMQLKERKSESAKTEPAPNEAQPDEPKRRLPSLVWRLCSVGVLVLLALGGWSWLQAQWRWNAYVEQLQNLPGIVVTRAERDWMYYRINGLRDPLALDPEKLLQDSNIPVHKVISVWEPYYALYPSFVLERVQKVLKPPKTVTLTMEQGTLTASGRASQDWVDRARDLAPGFPGVVRWNADQLTAIDERSPSN